MAWSLSERDPERQEEDAESFSNALKIGKELLPRSDSFQDISEMLVDLKLDANAARVGFQSTPTGPVGKTIGAAGAVALRRGGKELIKKGIKKGVDLLPKVDYEGIIDMSLSPLKKLNETWQGFTARMNAAQDLSTGGMFGTGGPGTGGFGNPFQKKVFQRTYSRSFTKGRGGFNYNEWKGYLKQHLGDTKAKYSLESFQTRDTQFVRQFFNKQKTALKPAFLEEYGEWMARNGIDPETLELHHIFGVMQSAGLYNGVDHMDEGWELVTGIMNKHDLFPGAPATDVAKFSNFKYVTKELHDILHHQFLTKKLGIDGSKFFDERILYNGKKMKRIDIINSGLEGRGFVAEEYAKIIVEGRDLMDEGLLQMEALFSKSGITDPDVLVKVLSKATDKGDIFLGNTDLLLESVNKELKAIAKDINWTDAERVAGEKGLGTFGIDNTRREIKKKYRKK